MPEPREQKCGRTRPPGGLSCILQPHDGGWHKDSQGNEWPQYAQDPELDAILNGTRYQSPTGEPRPGYQLPPAGVLPAGTDAP